MLIPKYLQEISENVKVTKLYEIVKIKCSCGCYQFLVYKFFEQEKIDAKPDSHEIIHEKGKLYLVKRNFFGKIIEKNECGNIFDKKPRKIVKVKCRNCGLEHTLFDNYKNGFDAMTTPEENCISNNDTPMNFKRVHSQPLDIYAKLYQDISYDEFREEYENLDYDAFLNSFTSIDIYGVGTGLRKVRICSEETA